MYAVFVPGTSDPAVRTGRPTYKQGGHWGPGKGGRYTRGVPGVSQGGKRDLFYTPRRVPRRQKGPLLHTRKGPREASTLPNSETGIKEGEENSAQQ